jgi:hypothetical protein
MGMKKILKILVILLTLIIAVNLLLWYSVEPEGDTDTEGMLCVKSKITGKYGYFYRGLFMVIWPRFDQAYSFSEGLAAVKIGKKWGFINKIGGMVIAPRYIGAVNFKSDLAAVEVQPNKWGFLDQQGRMIIDPWFNELKVFSFFRGEIIVKKDNQWIYYDKHKKLQICSRIDVNFCINNKIIYVVENGKWGFVNYDGKVTIKPYYDFMDYNNGYCIVEINGKYGVVDQNGNVIIPIQYLKDAIMNFQYGQLILKISNKLWIWNSNEKNKITNRVETQEINQYYKEQLALINENGKYGFINRKGNIVIQPKYDLARPFVTGLAAVKVRHQWGFINYDGKIVIPIRYNSVTDFDRGIAIIEKNKKYGILNSNGKMVVGFLYDALKLGGRGFFAKKNNKWGSIDKNGKEVFEFIYDEIVDVYGVDGYLGKKDKKNRLIDVEGNLIVNTQFDEIRVPFSDEADAQYIPAKVSRKWGYINSKGEILINPKYDEVTDFYTARDLAGVKLGRKWGLIDKKGTMIVKPQFDWVDWNWDYRTFLVHKFWRTYYIDDEYKLHSYHGD